MAMQARCGGLAARVAELGSADDDDDEENDEEEEEGDGGGGGGGGSGAEGFNPVGEIMDWTLDIGDAFQVRASGIETVVGGVYTQLREAVKLKLLSFTSPIMYPEARIQASNSNSNSN